MSREEMFKGDIGQAFVEERPDHVFDPLLAEGVFDRRIRMRDSVGGEAYLVDSPTYERLNSWCKVTKLVDAHYHNLYLFRSDKKRKFFKAEKRDVYLVALLNVPLYSEDVRLAGWPVTVETITRMVTKIHEAYKETAGLIKAQADFPTYSSATVEVRWIAKEFEPWLNKLTYGECTIEDILEMIEVALTKAEGIGK